MDKKISRCQGWEGIKWATAYLANKSACYYREGNEKIADLLQIISHIRLGGRLI